MGNLHQRRMGNLHQKLLKWFLPMFLHLFGVAKATLESQSVVFLSDKRFALLTYLALQTDWVSRDHLALIFFADSQDSRKNLRHLLSRVRELDFAKLETNDNLVRWAVNSDVLEFNRAFAAADWQSAVQWYTGLLLERFSLDLPEFITWLEVEQETLKNSFKEATLAFTTQLEASSQIAQTTAVFGQALRLEPLAEDVLQAFLRFASRQKSTQSSALAAFETFNRLLKQEMGLQPLESTRLLYQQLKNTPLDLEPIAKLRGFTAINTAFIGRERELEEIQTKLLSPDIRLLTLVGQGGIGKTRLAIQTAFQMAGRFEDGATFIALANLSSAVQILPALFAVLELPLTNPETALEKLKTHLQDQEMLLVADNLEHLLDGTDLLLELLHDCPKLKMLVTSREVLDRQNEYLLDVFGMAVPTANTPNFEMFDAVQLFVRSAKKTNSRFSLEAAQHDFMVQICQFLGGLPLALELASHWTRVLSLEEIVAQLKQGLGFLESTQAELPERHRSLRAVFEYTWRQLNQTEQNALQKLSVFQNGFTKEAAESIATISVQTLLRLCNKSLLQRGSNGRFERHAMIQELSFEKLRSEPELQQAQQTKHSDYYFAFIEQRPMGGSTDQQYLSQIESDLENIRSAWYFAASQKDYLQLERSTDLVVFFDRKARCAEGIELFEAAVTALETATTNANAVLGKASYEIAWLGHRIGRYDMALAERAVQLLQPLEDNNKHGGWLMKALNTLSMIAEQIGDNQKALENVEKALMLAKSLKHQDAIANYLSRIGDIENNLGLIQKAQEHYFDALEIHKILNNQFGCVIIYNNLGLLKMNLADFSQARKYLTNGLELAQEIKYTQAISFLLNNLGNLTLKTKEYEKARDFCLEALTTNEQLSNSTVRATSFMILGRVSIAKKMIPEAIQYFQKSLKIAWSVHELPIVMQNLVGLSELHIKLGNTSQASEFLHIVNHHPSTDESSRREANILLEESPELSPPIEFNLDLELHNAIMGILENPMSL